MEKVSHYLNDRITLLIASHYLNDRTQKLDSRNYGYFANPVLFSKFTSKLRALFFSGKLKFSWASRHLITFARRESCQKRISIPNIILILFVFQPFTSYSRPAKPFYWYGPQLREKNYCGPHAFLPRNSGLFLAALMAKTNVRPFYFPENGKPFHEEIKRAKRPHGPHKMASLAKCGLRATGWTALEDSLSEAQVLPPGMGISEY